AYGHVFVGLYAVVICTLRYRTIFPNLYASNILWILSVTISKQRLISNGLNDDIDRALVGAAIGGDGVGVAVSAAVILIGNVGDFAIISNKNFSMPIIKRPDIITLCIWSTLFGSFFY